MNQDKIHQHTIQFQRIINKAMRDTIFPAMGISYKEIRAILLEAESLSSVTQVAGINRDIAKIIKKRYGDAWPKITKELQDIATYEASYSANLLAETAGVAVAITTPTKKQTVDFVSKQLMSLHSGDKASVGLWDEFVQGNIDENVRTVNNLVKAAYVRGDTVQQATTSIRNAVNGVLKTHAETLARTGVSHYSNQAVEAMGQANLDVIESRYFSATLDSKTSVTCASLDGSTYKMTDTSFPRLPLHYNERSRYIFLVQGQKYPDGSRAAIGAGENYDKGDTYTGRKSLSKGDFKITQARPSTSYEDFLRRQPKDFQENVLGVGKAKLFREGVPLSKFTDMTGRPLTLAELKKFES